MHKPAAVLENDTHKLLWDFDVQTDHLISTKPYSNQQKKRELEKLWTLLFRMT